VEHNLSSTALKCQIASDPHPPIKNFTEMFEISNLHPQKAPLIIHLEPFRG